MAKKTVAPARPVIKQLGAPATVTPDRISQSDTGESVTVPGRLSDWLNPRTRGKSPLDPVLLAARDAGKKKKGAYRRRPVNPATVTPTEVETGHDGLPRPRGGR